MLQFQLIQQISVSAFLGGLARDEDSCVQIDVLTTIVAKILNVRPRTQFTSTALLECSIKRGKLPPSYRITRDWYTWTHAKALQMWWWWWWWLEWERQVYLWHYGDWYLFETTVGGEGA
jgi:hypothetical protein